MLTYKPGGSCTELWARAPPRLNSKIAAAKVAAANALVTRSDGARITSRRNCIQHGSTLVLACPQCSAVGWLPS